MTKDDVYLYFHMKKQMEELVKNIISGELNLKPENIINPSIENLGNGMFQVSGFSLPDARDYSFEISEKYI